VKPERLCFWLFEACGLRPDDQLDDLFPGTGAVTDAWNRWRSEPSLLAQLNQSPQNERKELA
jgi:hypothetical protein